MNEEEKNKKLIDMLSLDIITSKELIANTLKEKKEDCNEFIINDILKEFKKTLIIENSWEEVERIIKKKKEILIKQLNK